MRARLSPRQSTEKAIASKACVDGAVNWAGTATSGQPDPDATIPLIDEIGVTVVVTDARTLGAVGIAHVPGPVRPDDLIAFGEGHPWRGPVSGNVP